MVRAASAEGDGTWRRRGPGGLLTAVGLVALLVGCSGGNNTPATPIGQPGGPVVDAAEPTPSPSPPPAPLARIVVRPGNGAADVSPVKPVVIAASGGTLTTVQVANPAGERIKGTLSADRTRWTSAEPLGYDKSYSVRVVAANAEGAESKARARFSTVTPRTFTLPYLFPGDGVSTVGVGQPISVRFDEPIQDKAAAERSLRVSTTPAVRGAWHWFSDQVVHWRPRTYWAPGTQVRVTAKVYGVHVGDGIYGQQDVSSSFRIGRSRIATVDDRTHQMTVRVDGKVVRTIPVAMGKNQSISVGGRTINYLTQSGPHIVAEKHQVKVMSSASYGVTDKKHPEYYEEKIPLAVRISPDGEFVHAASWSVADQGVRNVSHGCVNISPTHAQWFYDNFGYGDIVDIRNTGRALPQAAGYNEWGIPWSEWVAGGALR